MRFTRTKAIIATAGLALSLAACGNAGEDSDTATDVDVADNAADSFDDGTQMKELADSGSITIGVKFDQPGIGFKGATDDMPQGFDPEIGKILAGSLGIAPEDITWKETISDPERLLRFASFVNSDAPDPTIQRVEIRGQRVPA